MCATVQEIMNRNHLWNDGLMKGNTICPQPFHGGGIKIVKIIQILKNVVVYEIHFNSKQDLKFRFKNIISLWSWGQDQPSE
jgi:hypothetical protein